MFRFYQPWLALLLPLPFLLRMFFGKAKRDIEREPPILRFPSLERLKAAFVAHSGTRDPQNRTVFFLLFLVWACLVLAVMQPENVDQFTRTNEEGYDLMLAVDISTSMNALDFSTDHSTLSRLDVVKDVVSKFVRKRQGDRVGLIVFGENAYLYIPFTLDTLAVSDMLDEVVSGMAGTATAIGDAIGLAVKNFRERPEGSRVLVLLTDGEDNSSQVPPLEAAKLAKKYGIKIYTIGVGKNGPVLFPTRKGGYMMVHMTMDENLLKEVASLTGGHYFLATDERDLKEIYDKIDTLEKSRSSLSTHLIREPLYRYPLFVSVLLLILLALIPVYRRVA